MKPLKPRRFSFRPSRARQIRTVTILPSLITMVNGLLGFAAIGLATQGSKYFSLAGYLIFYAMIADMLDGRVARMSHSTSSFGGQLDSLCDVISFGTAPAILTFRVMMQNFPDLFGSRTFFFSDFFQRFIWLAPAAYLSCAAIRLARFNVENEEDESSHMSFTGLPSPAAAGVIAGLVILIEHLAADPSMDSPFFIFMLKGLLYALPFIAIGAGILMVSRIQYPHLVNQYLRGRKPIMHLFWIAVLAAMIWQAGLPASLVITFGAFALSGVVRWIWQALRPASPATGGEGETSEAPFAST